MPPELMKFIAHERSIKASLITPREIEDCWFNRVEPNEWHTKAYGGKGYLAKYGKNIGFEKAVWLAIAGERHMRPSLRLSL